MFAHNNSVLFPDISFRDEGFPKFILRWWLGGHVFATSFVAGWGRVGFRTRACLVCKSCIFHCDSSSYACALFGFANTPGIMGIRRRLAALERVVL